MARPKSPVARKTYSFRLPPNLVKVLKHIAIDDERGKSELVEEAITEWLKNRDAKKGAKS